MAHVHVCIATTAPFPTCTTVATTAQCITLLQRSPRLLKTNPSLWASIVVFFPVDLSTDAPDDVFSPLSWHFPSPHRCTWLDPPRTRLRSTISSQQTPTIVNVLCCSSHPLYVTSTRSYWKQTSLSLNSKQCDWTIWIDEVSHVFAFSFGSLFFFGLVLLFCIV